jgi:single-stranded-DNA-specific exonuclease
MEIKNLKKAAERIKKAVKSKEKIILYGDADLDGVSSAIILEETIKNLGGDVAAVYFPDRESEGYGLSKTGLDHLKKLSPALLITMDCGIGNFTEMKLAKKLGFFVLIIEHHEVLDKLPQAKIIVDPKQKSDRYSFKGLANAGIVFKLAGLIMGKKMSETMRKNFVELAALSTIADTMPEIDENKIMIDEGLASLKDTWRPGLKIFFELDEVQNAGSLRMAAQRIVSILNVIEPKGHLNATYLLLMADSIKEARMLMNELSEKRDRKQREIREITEEIEAIILQKGKEAVIFEGNYSWSLGVLGAVASRICNKHQKATFLFRKKEKESRGAVRTPQDVDAVQLMKKCSKYLLTFGGHARAAGFSVKNENLEKFKTCLAETLNK